jgi:hypothetical protein
MNAELKPTQLAATSADLTERIDAERRRLLLEQNLEKDLEGQRLAPLEAGDDAALDDVESKINSCSDRQARIEERLAILQRRLDEALANERQAVLDDLRARADAAREAGEGLIRREYLKHAKSLVAALAKLQAIDVFIERANRVLTRASEQLQVPSPNAIRQQPMRRVEKTVRRTVNIFDRLHPHYGNAHIPINRQYGLPAKLGLKDGGECDTEVEIEEIVEEIVGPYWREPLTTEVVLPSVEPTAEPLWHPTNAERLTYDEHVLADIGIDPSMPEIN